MRMKRLLVCMTQINFVVHTCNHQFIATFTSMPGPKPDQAGTSPRQWLFKAKAYSWAKPLPSHGESTKGTAVEGMRLILGAKERSY
jgi:hypothetical protein